MEAKTVKQTVVRKSTIHGKGLFAARDFAAGDMVEPIEGEIVLRDSTSKYAIALPGRRTLILAGKTKFVNHSSKPNVSFNIRRKTPCIMALRDIVAGEELTSAYDSVFG